MNKVGRSEYQFILLPQGPIYTGRFTKKGEYLNSSIPTALWAQEIQSHHSLYFPFLVPLPCAWAFLPWAAQTKNAVWTDPFLPLQRLRALAGRLQIVRYIWHQVPLCVRGARRGTMLPSSNTQKSKQPFPYTHRWIVICVCLLLHWVFSSKGHFILNGRWHSCAITEFLQLRL